jgi:hypothetical protein
MDKETVVRVPVACECNGSGFVGVQDSGGDDVELVECETHHPAYREPSIMERFAGIEQQTAELKAMLRDY